MVVGVHSTGLLALYHVDMVNNMVIVPAIALRQQMEDNIVMEAVINTGIAHWALVHLQHPFHQQHLVRVSFFDFCAIY